MKPNRTLTVPLIATPEMLRAGGYGLSAEGKSTTGQQVWEAMILAAPEAPHPEPDPELSRIVGEGVGEASMCWSESPRGVFESERAVAITERILIAARVTIAAAMRRLVYALKTDEEYRYGWQANIAMAFVDQYGSRSLVSGEQPNGIAHEDVKELANRAAAAFLDQLTGKDMGDLPGAAAVLALHASAEPLSIGRDNERIIAAVFQWLAKCDPDTLAPQLRIETQALRDELDRVAAQPRA